MNDFRFQQLTIWQESVEIMEPLYEFAERVSLQKYFKFAEQLRAAGLSISNNIAEGSGSSSNKEFANFLNISRRSIFECANMMLVFENFGFISALERQTINGRLLKLSAQIINFKKTLK
ncbi:MAG: four helix bundle protein [Bacteroidales bacterium]|jgi:four helix bundle protein|nr:four helix bundle protein [Bacteroidales bacterium]